MITDKDRARAIRMLLEEAREDAWAEEEGPAEVPGGAKAALARAHAIIRQRTKDGAIRALLNEPDDEEGEPEEEPSPAAALALAKAKKIIAERTVDPNAPKRNVVDIRTHRLFRDVGIGFGSMVALAAGFFLFLQIGERTVARNDHVLDVGYTAPTFSTGTAPPDSAMLQAYRSCAKKRYDECLRWLDHAKTEDPDIERSEPDYLILRADAEKELKQPH